MKSKQELKEFLISLKNDHPKMALGGTISVCKNPGKKYYEERLAILEYTKHLPESIDIGTRIYFIMNDMEDYALCKCGCGNKVNNHTHLYLPYHGNKCEEVQAKKLKSLQEHYNIKHNINHICDKKEYTREKQKNSNKKFIYTKNYIKRLKEIKDCQFNLLFNVDEYDNTKNEEYRLQCKSCGNIFTNDFTNMFMIICRACHPLINVNGESSDKYDIINFLKEMRINMQINEQELIHPLVLDIYCPDQKIAIEYNNLYSHSVVYGKKDKNYHLNKTKLCKDKGIRLIHIFEDEWKHKQQIVKNRLRHIFHKDKYKIYARKCIIREIDSNIKNKFLNKYHIQGADKSNIKLGAFYKNRLIAVMTFSNLRITLGRQSEENSYELCRFVSLPHFNCVGIANKLLSYFERNYKWEKLVTYADLRWSIGDLYDKLGFQKQHISKPNYWYIDFTLLKRWHRYNYAKHLLKDKLIIFDESLSEWENMLANGHDKIYDCGNIVYSKNNTNIIRDELALERKLKDE